MKPMVLYTLQNNVFTGSEGRWGKHLSDLKGDLRGHEIFMLMVKGELPRLFVHNTGRVRKRRKTVHGRCIVEAEELDDDAFEYG